MPLFKFAEPLLIAVLPHYDAMYVAAREYIYSADEFQKIDRLLRKNAPLNWSPHYLWHVAITKKPKAQDKTYLQIALARYQSIIDEGKMRK